MHKEIAIAEAMRKLPSIIHDVEAGMPVRLTRRGKPVAVVVAINDYQRSEPEKEGFWDAFMAFRKTLEKENIEFSDSDFENLRDKTVIRRTDTFFC